MCLLTSVSGVGCGLKVDRYNCTIPISGLNDPACTEVGEVFVCATNVTVKPWFNMVKKEHSTLGWEQQILIFTFQTVFVLELL